MSSKLLSGFIAFIICLMLVFAGCAPESETAGTSGISGAGTKVQLNFAAGDSAKYKVAIETTKDFKFEQPSLGKLKEEQTGSEIEMIYTQTIDSVDAEGNAVATIGIEGIKYVAKNKSGVVLDFDSATNTEHALAKLIGKSYKIKVSPSGSVSSVDISKARGVSGDKFVKSFLKDATIAKRHEILALPEASEIKAKAGASWSKVKSPPPGMLDPKNFEKTYTLKSIRGNTATIEMQAIPTSKKAADEAPKSDSGMGIFAKMFDSEDSWSGNLSLDLSSGKISKYNEKLVSTYVAAEESRFQVEGKGPDTLTMGLTSSVNLEKID